jgi:hypothetical protein
LKCLTIIAAMLAGCFVAFRGEIAAAASRPSAPVSGGPWIPFALIVGYVCAAAVYALRRKWVNASSRLAFASSAVAIVLATCAAAVGAYVMCQRFGMPTSAERIVLSSALLCWVGPATVVGLSWLGVRASKRGEDGGP